MAAFEAIAVAQCKIGRSQQNGRVAGFSVFGSGGVICTYRVRVELLLDAKADVPSTSPKRRFWVNNRHATSEQANFCFPPEAAIKATATWLRRTHLFYCCLIGEAEVRDLSTAVLI